MQLGHGLGLVDETRTLLDLWQPGMKAPDLYRSVLQAGYFGALSAQRLHDMISVGFGMRYLTGDAAPARLLKPNPVRCVPGSLQAIALSLHGTRASCARRFCLPGVLACVRCQQAGNGQ